MSYNLLFWSTKCQTCANIMNMLKSENLINNFKLVCVDNNLKELSKQIKEVPTMIVVGLPEPLLAKDIYKWIQNIRFLKSKQTTAPNNSPPPPNEPIGYKLSEMGEITDQFAYKDIDLALPQSFFNVGDEYKTTIYTAPKDKKKISKTEQQYMIKNLDDTRKVQEKEFTDKMKIEQMNILKQLL